MSIVMMLILSFLYMYFIFEIGSIEKGWIKDLITYILIALVLVVSSSFDLTLVGVIISTVIAILFDLFYDEEIFYNQWKWILSFGISIEAIFILDKVLIKNTVIAMLVTVLITYVILAAYRKQLKTKVGLLTIDRKSVV